MTWLTTKNRKTHQRKLNRYIKHLNQNIANDNLWKGRFYIRQKMAAFYIYEDQSGAELKVILEMHDRKTGKICETYGTANALCRCNGYPLWEKMNWFIVEYIKVWDENPSPWEKE